MAHVRRGDEVIVLTGKDAGKRGKILHVDTHKSRVKVEKVNLIKKHVRPSQKNPQGGIVEKEGTIHISNVRLWDAKAGAPTRVGMKRLEDGRKVRVSKKTGEIFDQK
jgi:large subunit ribosomal protein L24